MAMMKNHEMIQGSGEDVEAQVGKHRKAQRKLKAGLARDGTITKHPSEKEVKNHMQFAREELVKEVRVRTQDSRQMPGSRSIHQKRRRWRGICKELVKEVEEGLIRDRILMKMVEIEDSWDEVVRRLLQAGDDLAEESWSRLRKGARAVGGRPEPEARITTLVRQNGGRKRLNGTDWSSSGGGVRGSKGDTNLESEY